MFVISLKLCLSSVVVLNVILFNWHEIKLFFLFTTEDYDLHIEYLKFKIN